MTDWPATASAAFAGVGLLATAWQLRGRSADSAKERKLEIEGVCASWHPKFNPRPGDVDSEGFAVWEYDFFVHNPGRFPISSVELIVDFPVDVRRIRGQHLDRPARSLKMVHPVIAGADQRRWERTLRMKYSDADGQLRATTASVIFVDAQGVVHTTYWPRERLPGQTPQSQTS